MPNHSEQLAGFNKIIIAAGLIIRVYHSAGFQR